MSSEGGERLDLLEARLTSLERESARSEAERIAMVRQLAVDVRRIEDALTQLRKSVDLLAKSMASLRAEVGRLGTLEPADAALPLMRSQLLELAERVEIVSARVSFLVRASDLEHQERFGVTPSP